MCGYASHIPLPAIYCLRNRHSPRSSHQVEPNRKCTFTQERIRRSAQFASWVSGNRSIAALYKLRIERPDWPKIGRLTTRTKLIRVLASRMKKAARHPDAAFYLVHCKVLQHKNNITKLLICNEFYEQ